MKEEVTILEKEVQENEYHNIIRTFVDNVLTMETFVCNIEPVLENKMNECVSENEKFFDVFNTVIQSKIEPQECLESSERIAELEKYLKNTLNIEFKIDEEKEEWYLVGRGARSRKIGATLKKVDEVEKQIKIMYQSSLINLVIFFELLFASIFKKKFNDFPKSFGINEKNLSFEEISKLGSFENAKEYLLEKEVENIMRGSYDDWKKYIKEKWKRDLKFLNIADNVIIDIFQRRNILVHNNGIINNIFLSNVIDKKNYKIGEECFLQEKNAQSCKEKYTILQEKVHKKCVFFY